MQYGCDFAVNRMSAEHNSQVCGSGSARPQGWGCSAQSGSFSSCGSAVRQTALLRSTDLALPLFLPSNHLTSDNASTFQTQASLALAANDPLKPVVDQFSS